MNNLKYKNVMILQSVSGDHIFYTGYVLEVRDNGDCVVEVSWLSDHNRIVHRIDVVAKKVVKWSMKDSLKSFLYGIMTPSLWIFMIFGSNGQNTLIRSGYYLKKVCNNIKEKK